MLVDDTKPALSNTVAGGVLNLFVRCLDVNGDPIPWLDTTLKYNSAEPMQAATPGVRKAVAASTDNPSSFLYTYFNADVIGDPQNTVSANMLPCSVELTLVTVDLKTLQRLGPAAVPPPPSPSASSPPTSYPPNALPAGPLAVPGNIALFVRQAQAAGFRDVRTFSTVVRLQNAPR